MQTVVIMPVVYIHSYAAYMWLCKCKCACMFWSRSCPRKLHNHWTMYVIDWCCGYYYNWEYYIHVWTSSTNIIGQAHPNPYNACAIYIFIIHMSFCINVLHLDFCEGEKFGILRWSSKVDLPALGVQTVNWEACPALTVTLHLNNHAFKITTLHSMFSIQLSHASLLSMEAMLAPQPPMLTDTWDTQGEGDLPQWMHQSALGGRSCLQ